MASQSMKPKGGGKPTGALATKIQTDFGSYEKFAELFESDQRRVWVPLGQLPEYVSRAFVSAEDGKFYEHEGFDFAAIVRAAIANLREGGIAQGASTITQQTVKSLLLSPEKTYKRKLRDPYWEGRERRI